MRILHLALAVQFLAAPFAATAASTERINGEFIAEGIYGLQKPLTESAPVKADADWTFHFWMKPSAALADKTLIAGFGDRSNQAGTQRYLASFDDGLRFWGASVDVSMNVPAQPGEWHMLAAVHDQGMLRLYYDGREVASQAVALQDAAPELNMAPLSPWGDGGHFGGRIAQFTLEDRALSPEEIQKLVAGKSDFDALVFEKGLPKSWDPKANTTNLGIQGQAPESLPKSNAAPSAPKVTKRTPAPSITPDGDGSLILSGEWKLIEAPKVSGDGASLSRAGVPTDKWLPATVPGTVLTTFVDQGVYPDPLFGLNNMAIPTTLAHQDYWYRVEFDVPLDYANRPVTLTFHGINYRAEVWLNGGRLGDIKGAFIRGIFDVGEKLKPGQKNALAVKVSPPENPSISHEQSPRSGTGPNGGAMCLDGPTFFCSEGWDWIPGIRDRNTGLWQDVVLKATGPVRIGDPQVVTRIPEPVGSRADVTIEVDLENETDRPQAGTLKAAFEGVIVEKKVTVPVGGVTVAFSPAEFPTLAVANPRLWWPNGYGSPELYDLTLSFVTDDGKPSDEKKTRFGMREVSVVLTAMTPQQREGRFEFFPAAARATEVIGHDHASLVDSRKGWIPMLAGDAGKLPGLRESNSTDTDRFLEIRVNGVRIPIRGGNWGMDDAMKRVSRADLEPYIRLQRDANFNILRNWCGQSTEKALFELCDEYGIMVWSEFWVSTQWANVEPKDPELFLANAADTIKRFRTHPSIVIWCGRNEGVPPAAINEGLDRLIRELDGTRYYQPASITINLAGSGPWKYIPPVEYFEKKGLQTELGLPSPMTADGIRAMLAPEDLWPPNDVWAYHDWLEGNAMDVTTFMAALEAQYGAPTGFEDFVRKAQMINFTSHRAMYEALNANLWKPSTGTLLWMSHPSWPSFVWQIYGHDYEPNAALYGVKKACEPIHVQMNLPDSKVLVSNTTTRPLQGAKITATVYSLDAKPISSKEAMIDVPVNSTAESFVIEDATAPGAVRFVVLELRDAAGALLSENFYWHAAKAADCLALDKLPKVKLAARAKSVREATRTRVAVEVANPSKSVVLMAHLTLRDAGTGERILPAFASDNYLNLLPGQKRMVTFECAATGPLSVGLDGWNVAPHKVSVN